MSQTNLTTNAIIHYLNLNNCFAWRNNSTGVYDPVKKVFRKPKNQLNGVADILGMFYDGQFLAVEVKTGRDKQSDAQINFQQRVEEHNGIYIIAKDFDDFLTQYLTIINK